MGGRLITFQCLHRLSPQRLQDSVYSVQPGASGFVDMDLSLWTPWCECGRWDEVHILIGLSCLWVEFALCPSDATSQRSFVFCFYGDEVMTFFYVSFIRMFGWTSNCVQVSLCSHVSTCRNSLSSAFLLFFNSVQKIKGSCSTLHLCSMLAVAILDSVSECSIIDHSQL